MLIYVVISELETGEQNVLGAFTQREMALRKRGEYEAENQKERCWVQEFDTENWQYETGEYYRMLHQTMVHKFSGLVTHVIIFTKEEFPLVEEEGDWYVIRREDSSFDKENGLKINLQVLKEVTDGQLPDIPIFVEIGIGWIE